MHTHVNRLLTLCVLTCCLFAVGATASSLDDTVTSDPGDAVDLNWEKLPIGPEEAGRLKERWKPTSADGGPTTSAPADGEGDTDESKASGGGSDESAGGADSGAAGASDATGGSGNGGDAGSAEAASNGGQNSNGVSVSERGLLALLFDLLRALVVGLLFVGLLVGCLVLFRRLRPDDAGDRTEAARSGTSVGPVAPSNDVSRAWFELMTRFDLADAHHLTPAERARAAVERGADPDGVRPLTDLFERTRYGDAPVTDDRSRRARQWLDRATARTTVGATRPDGGTPEGRT